MKPHKHAKVIKAWADGHDIQCLLPNNLVWENAPFPTWTTAYDYRIKAKFKVGDAVAVKYFTETLTVTGLKWTNENSEIIYTLSNKHTCFEPDLSLVIDIKPKFKIGDTVTFTTLSYYVEKTIKSIKMDTQNIVYFFTDGSFTEFENKLQLVTTIPFTFEDADFLIGKAVKHKINNEVALIVGITKNFCVFGGIGNLLFSELLEHCTFLDGSPCGKSIHKK